MTTNIIIGAGLGGLAAALRLRNHGFEVLVLEKQSRVGGRSNLIEERGFRVDIGPTILVMKSMFEETYRAIGRDFDERIKLVRLDPNYRIYYADDTYLDLFSSMPELSAEVARIEPGGTERMFRFIGEGAKKYELGMDFVVRNYNRITDLANPMAALRMIQTSAYRNLYGQVSRFFHTDKLRKAFSFHSMFLGLSPFESPAMYSMITYADLTGGMYYPMGGIYSIIEDMIRIAAETGVQIRTEAAVEEILIENGRAVGVRLASGEQLRADIIVSNADLPYTYRSLIPSRHRKAYPDSRLERMRYSCSGYILFLGLDKTYPNMRHQALYFSGDYRASLDAIFRAGALPEEPSFHLNNPTITDPGLAPPGHSLLYVLAPMPTLRPHNKAHDIEGLYFVGQGTYPGIGTPMVLISARLLAERLTQA